ncbi:UNVERIFIED_CONTAM: hypothetical protein Sradi_6268200 [Sesamum radiatum]|uniref:Uncharacterized protein n=1 Tax=Sesamum radiatum TaxID=300843 RepID=A0AAW2KDJ1_SESRA
MSTTDALPILGLSDALTIPVVPFHKAWFRRAKANSSLSNYQDAINDLTVSLKIETSLSGKRQIESELSTLLDQSRQRSSAVEKPNDDSSDEQLQVELQCVSTPTRGRGMTTSTDIPLASLIHKEDPYAAIILKNCRETHCAFCFNELPADTVPCMSCSNPLYCSLKCQLQAGGQEFSKYKSKYEFPEDLSDVLEQYIRTVTSPGILSSNVEHAEHRHECLGMHWPAVLPSDVILAGRILVKHIQQQGCDGVQPKYHGILDMLNDDNISRVASRLFEQTDYSCCFEPGYCLSCGSLCDLEASQKTITKAEICIKSLQDALASCETPTTLIMDALKSVDILRTLLHPFNRRIAEVEDNVAQAFCSIGEIQAAMDHCQASIKILEKLYGEDHIVIGNELIKLSSIQLSMGQKSTADNTNRMVAIFSRYYGSHADIMFPYLRYLKREAGKLV